MCEFLFSSLYINIYTLIIDRISICLPSWYCARLISAQGTNSFLGTIMSKLNIDYIIMWETIHIIENDVLSLFFQSIWIIVQSYARSFAECLKLGNYEIAKMILHCYQWYKLFLTQYISTFYVPKISTNVRWIWYVKTSETYVCQWTARTAVCNHW